MISYDLRTEPWIPVLYSDDVDSKNLQQNVVIKIGLIKLFEDAHKIQKLVASNHLENAALLRFFLALFIDIFNKNHDKETWFRIWDEGRFNTTKLKDYFYSDINANAFDLAHPTRPFYQHPETLQGVDVGKLSKLFPCLSSGNNATLFNHNTERNEKPMEPDHVARALIYTQAFAAGGGVSRPFNFSHGPLMGKTLFFIKANSLFRSILLNMPPDENSRQIDNTFLYNETPLPPTWRQEIPSIHSKRSCLGILDLLTWQSRRIKLLFDKDEDGRVLVNGLYFSQGFKIDPEISSDPHIAYLPTDDNGLKEYKLTFEGSVWNQYDHILSTRKNKETPGGPLTFVFLKNNLMRLGFQRFSSVPINVIFEDADQAKINYIGESEIFIYPEIIDNTLVIKALENAKKIVSEQKVNLYKALKETARALLSPIRPGKLEPENPDKNQVSNLVNSFGWQTLFLERFNTAYPELVSKIVKRYAELEHSGDEDTLSEELNSLIINWESEVKKITKEVFKNVTLTFLNDGKKVNAVVYGMKKLRF